METVDHGAVALLPGEATEVRMEGLRRLQAEHPFWKCRLLSACESGVLTAADFRVIFQQYRHYSRGFTRLLGGLLAATENDAFRATLSENLWEESGGTRIEERHSEIFRRFLEVGLKVNEAPAEACTTLFCDRMLRYCTLNPSLEVAAALSFGTEGIVARMYGVFVRGLLGAGIGEEHLEFFRIHMECDDDHAIAIERELLRRTDEPAWFERCRAAMDAALAMRAEFFDGLYELVLKERLRPILEPIQAKRSLYAGGISATSAGSGAEHATLYENTVSRLGIEFRVTHAGFAPEVLDPRFVHIPPGKRNERHKHAHETIFYIVRGVGRVEIDGNLVSVSSGDMVFVPRWSVHQSHNDGTEDMVILAVTDYGLTGRAFVGNYLSTARLKSADARNESPRTVSNRADTCSLSNVEV